MDLCMCAECFILIMSVSDRQAAYIYACTLCVCVWGGGRVIDPLSVIMFSAVFGIVQKSEGVDWF